LRGSQNRPWGDGKWTCNERDKRRNNRDRDDNGSHKKYLEDRMNPVRQIIRRSNAKHDILASLRGLDLAKATAFAARCPRVGWFATASSQIRDVIISFLRLLISFLRLLISFRR
jgi:hypothetical protein